MTEVKYFVPPVSKSRDLYIRWRLGGLFLYITHTHVYIYFTYTYFLSYIYILSSYPPVYIVSRPKGDRRMSETNPPASSTTSSDRSGDWKYFPGHS